ncbi:MAG: YbaB/EbfC family nucleoid-associated protein, partial [Oscillospiraceae bacterium]
MKARLPQGMGGGAQNMNQIIKQAQKMQDEMKELQDKLDITEYQGESGGGLVKVTVTGKHDAVAVKIDPSAIDVDDIEMLEDLVAAALNDGISKAR